MASDDSEPAKLTEEMKSEGTEEEPIDNMVKPVDTVSPEDVQTEYEEVKPVEDTTYIETAKVERMRPVPERLRKTKRKRSNATESESKSLSKLHGELRKHSDARRKTDLAVKDVEKQLKALLLAHHAAIKDLKKQVNVMNGKLAAIESKRSPSKATAKKKLAKSQKTEIMKRKSNRR